MHGQRRGEQSGVDLEDVQLGLVVDRAFVLARAGLARGCDFAGKLDKVGGDGGVGFDDCVDEGVVMAVVRGKVLRGRGGMDAQLRPVVAAGGQVFTPASLGRAAKMSGEAGVSEGHGGGGGLILPAGRGGGSGGFRGPELFAGVVGHVFEVGLEGGMLKAGQDGLGGDLGAVGGGLGGGGGGAYHGAGLAGHELVIAGRLGVAGGDAGGGLGGTGRGDFGGWGLALGGLGVAAAVAMGGQPLVDFLLPGGGAAVGGLLKEFEGLGGEAGRFAQDFRFPSGAALMAAVSGRWPLRFMVVRTSLEQGRERVAEETKMQQICLTAPGASPAVNRECRHFVCGQSDGSRVRRDMPVCYAGH